MADTRPFHGDGHVQEGCKWTTKIQVYFYLFSKYRLDRMAVVIAIFHPTGTVAQSPILTTTITLSRLRRKGYESMLSYYLKTQPTIQ